MCVSILAFNEQNSSKMSSAAVVDPRRPEKVNRYKAPQNGQTVSGNEELMPDYMNILGMIFSMCGLMMKLKWCGELSLHSLSAYLSLKDVKIVCLIDITFFEFC